MKRYQQNNHKRKNRRSLRIEELENREMLDAGLMSALDDIFSQASPVESDTIMAYAPQKQAAPTQSIPTQAEASNPTLTSSSKTDTTATLSWTAGADTTDITGITTQTLTGFELRYKTEAAAEWGDWTAVSVADSTALTTTVSGLTASTAYQFEMRSVFSGEGVDTLYSVTSNTMEVATDDATLGTAPSISTVSGSNYVILRFDMSESEATGMTQGQIGEITLTSKPLSEETWSAPASGLFSISYESDDAGSVTYYARAKVDGLLPSTDYQFIVQFSEGVSAEVTATTLSEGTVRVEAIPDTDRVYFHCNIDDLLAQGVDPNSLYNLTLQYKGPNDSDWQTAISHYINDYYKDGAYYVYVAVDGLNPSTTYQFQLLNGAEVLKEMAATTLSAGESSSDYSIVDGYPAPKGVKSHTESVASVGFTWSPRDAKQWDYGTDGLLITIYNPAVKKPTADDAIAVIELKETGYGSDAPLTAIISNTEGYMIGVSDANVTYTSYRGVSVPSYSFLITGLPNAQTKYTFGVQAVNSKSGEASKIVNVSGSTAKYAATKMDKPVSGVGSVTLTWAASAQRPADMDTLTAGDFDIIVKDAKGNALSEAESALIHVEEVVSEGSKWTATVTGLAAEKYTFAVIESATKDGELIARSAEGKKSASPEKYAAVKIDKPVSGVGSVALTWTASAQRPAGMDPVTKDSFDIIVKDAKGNALSDAESALINIGEVASEGDKWTATVTALAAQKYTFVVIESATKDGELIARSAEGKMIASPEKYAAPKMDKPVKGLGSVTLTWVASTQRPAGMDPVTKDSFDVIVKDAKGNALSDTESALINIGEVASEGDKWTATVTGLAAQKYTFVVIESATKDGELIARSAEGKKSDRSQNVKVTVVDSDLNSVDIGAGTIDVRWNIPGIDMTDLNDIAITYSVDGSGYYQEEGIGRVKGTFSGSGVDCKQGDSIVMTASSPLIHDTYTATLADTSAIDSSSSRLYITGLRPMFELVNTGKVQVNVTITEIKAKVDGAAVATTVWQGKAKFSKSVPVPSV